MRNIYLRETCELFIQMKLQFEDTVTLLTLYPKNLVTCAKSSKAKVNGVSDRQKREESDAVSAANIHSAA